MNKKTAILCVLVIFMMASCKKEKETKISQKDNFWVVLDSEKAQKTEGEWSWEFQLKRPGDYNIQIFRKGKQDTALSKVSVMSAGVTLAEYPETIFVIGETENEETISQFAKTIKFDKAGLQTLTLKSDTPIDKIRISPQYNKNLGFGTDKYYDDWLKMHNSPEKQQALEWFKQAKFGMFIHWGLYSQAGGIWKGKRMEEAPAIGPKVSEWLMYKFEISRNEYAELAKTFNPDKTFAQNIAKLAKDSGMKYVVITSKHHDGFALFDSKVSEFDMVDATPYKADVVMELYDACLAEGLAFGVYYSHGNDWFDGADGNFKNVKKVNDSLGILSHPNGKNLWDPSPNTHAEYITQKALPQVSELLEALPELRLIWFDGDGYITENQAFEFYKTVYNSNPNVLVNRRVGFDFGDYLDAGDNKIPSASEKMSKHFETCGTTNNSWAYKSYDDDWKSTKELLYYLVDIASKGGNFLLNIGPDGEGHVPEQSAQGLLELGDWLKTNGEAIYGTTRWTTTREGNEDALLGGTEHRAKKGFSQTFSARDFWFTAKENKVYAIAFVQAETTVTIKSLKLANGKVESVRLLGDSSEIPWKQSVDGLEVDLTGIKTGLNGYVLEIIMKNE
ncbi:alpha-L-fucosidase [Tamlana sp. 1_MG-2023]|uniref:alpha-L-fucosidase n=1 Tax=Tamlana sp. 1_MG-2023 TaxID=3062628 RepID=UPI0026E49675|nr:alpha-L-fucosidase [Tamlana sp. 1_MG-2023]MDO6792085.1 alpha-L-fucosidase [Tamlana sp. 1_MG-2023]